MDAPTMPQDRPGHSTLPTPPPPGDVAFWDRVGAACLLARRTGTRLVYLDRPGWHWTPAGLCHVTIHV